MKHKLLLVSWLLIILQSPAVAQAPGIHWQKTFGGSQIDQISQNPHLSPWSVKIKRVINTSDKGHIMAGHTNSNDGDVSGFHGGATDIWIIKIDSNRNKVWQRALGSTGVDHLYQIAPTHDGGLLVLGRVVAGNGDVTGFHSFFDIWVVKLSGSGNIEWNRCLGGTNAETPIDILETPTSEIMVLGATNSNDGDVSGNHGGLDYWLTKLSATGNLIWQKTYGGSLDETPFSFLQTPDGGFMLAGISASNDGMVTGNHFVSRNDIWVVKTDASGNLQWQHCYGGTETEGVLGTNWISTGVLMKQTADGGFIFLTNSGSDDGDLPGNYGRSDIWIFKTNAAGNIQWSKNYGGILEESPVKIVETPDGGYAFTGMTVSNDHDVSGLHGSSFKDVWVVKINQSGTIQWQRCLGGTSKEDNHDLAYLPDGGLLLFNTSSSSDGDITTPRGQDDLWFVKMAANGNMQWQKSIGSSYHDNPGEMIPLTEDVFEFVGTSGTHNKDVVGPPTGSIDLQFWIARLGSVSFIKGKAFLDVNGNGIKDGTEPVFTQGIVQSSKPGFSKSSALVKGAFLNEVDTGTYNTAIIFNKPYFTSVPVSHSTSFTTYFVQDSVEFAVWPIPGKRDYYATLFAAGPARVVRPPHYILKYGNGGTDTMVNGTVRLIKDSKLSFSYSIPMPSIVSGDTLTWNIASLKPGESGIIDITLTVNPSTPIGSTVESVAIIDTTGDLFTADNISVLRQEVVGGFDPNDKTSNIGASISPGEIAAGKSLAYTIRFQNTGNDTAFNIVVRDTLDQKLDWNSISMVDASHNYHLAIKDGNKLTWTFDNILLPDSIHNEAASHGYITYSIRPKALVALGDTLRNSASIYFDYNAPVKTNTTQTVVKLPLIVQQPSVSGIASGYCSTLGVQKGKLNNLPASGSGITVTVKLDGNTLAVAADSTFSFNVSSMAAGSHTIAVTYTSGSETKTTNVNFNVTAAATPDVNVSSNITTAINTIDPIIITAANAAGGGASPLYTFGKDRSFGTLWQAESANNVLNITPTSLQTGDNWIYVRMKTSSNCYTAQFNIDSIKIVYQLPAPNQPAITGLQISYCGTQGVQKAKLGNYPAAGTGMTVTVKLDGNTLSLVAADTSFSFNVSGLTAGNHTIEVTYSNSSGTKTTTANFSVSDAVTPVVNVTANKTSVSNATDQVIVTASNAGGGGTAPVYTFARNRTFTDILQAEGTANTFTLNGASFKLGDNKVYVRMKTSLSCYLQQTDMDSITIVKTGFAGLFDPDFPDVRISFNPNPFRSLLLVHGLNAGKSYTIMVYNQQGRLMRKVRVTGQQSARMNVPGLASGTYMVQLFDETKKRVIGTVEVVKQ